MPSCFAVRFMRRTNAASDPSMPIASVSAASLALGTIRPSSRSRPETRRPARSPAVDSPISVAATGTVYVFESAPSCSARYAVIIFVMLAIARGSSARRSARIVPSRPSAIT